MGFHPFGNRLADRRAGILLDEMRSGDRHFGLVLETPAKLPDSSDQDRTWLGIDEQLWNLVLRHPLRIVGYDLHHVRGLARDRDLARPGQRRPAVLSSRVGLAIF